MWVTGTHILEPSPDALQWTQMQGSGQNRELKPTHPDLGRERRETQMTQNLPESFTFTVLVQSVLNFFQPEVILSICGYWDSYALLQPHKFSVNSVTHLDIPASAVDSSYQLTSSNTHSDLFLATTNGGWSLKSWIQSRQLYIHSFPPPLPKMCDVATWGDTSAHFVYEWAVVWARQRRRMIISGYLPCSKQLRLFPTFF